MFTKGLLACALAVMAPSLAHAACAPATLTKVVTRNITPGIPPGHWAGQPTVLHRKGERFIRSEEPEDRQRKLHLMIVISEPDIWFVDKADKTGKHIVDPGPSLVAHAPIIQDREAPPELFELEYGCEAEFVRAHALPVLGSRTIDGRKATVYGWSGGERRLEMAMADDRPVELAYFIGARPAFAVHYDEFATGLPDQPGLFAKPEGYTYSEAAAPGQ